MARLGARTVYLQAAKADTRSPGPLVDEKLVGDFLVAAHQHGIRVCRVGTSRCWVIWTPISWTFAVLEPLRGSVTNASTPWHSISSGPRECPTQVRGTRGLVTFTKRVRRGHRRRHGARRDRVPRGAKPELINPSPRPYFPYRELAPYVDVWTPMVYWTFRTADYRDPFQYTNDSVQRLRGRLHDRHASVHPVGGIADTTTASDYERYLQAVRADKAIGWSVYDYNTTASSAWPRLRAGPGAVTTTTPTTPS